MRRVALWTTLLVTAGCGGGRPTPPAPQSLTDALSQFMAAVKANNLERMGQLWGTERGAAAGWMKSDELRMRLSVIQTYLKHDGYRVVQGPLAAADGSPSRRSFRIELQRGNCNAVLPIDLVRTRSGGWLVYDVHLESAPNPAARCPSDASGTRG